MPLGHEHLRRTPGRGYGAHKFVRSPASKRPKNHPAVLSNVRHRFVTLLPAGTERLGSSDLRVKRCETPASIASSCRSRRTTVFVDLCGARQLAGLRASAVTRHSRGTLRVNLFPHHGRCRTRATSCEGNGGISARSVVGTGVHSPFGQGTTAKAVANRSSRQSKQSSIEAGVNRSRRQSKQAPMAEVRRTTRQNP